MAVKKIDPKSKKLLKPIPKRCNKNKDKNARSLIRLVKKLYNEDEKLLTYHGYLVGGKINKSGVRLLKLLSRGSK